MVGRRWVDGGWTVGAVKNERFTVLSPLKRFLNSIPFFELRFTKNPLKIFPCDFLLIKELSGKFITKMDAQFRKLCEVTRNCA